ncbi:exodeoxyribonuclease III [archaeon]|jgi:exodeoxyribonuclease III|nr:exodeoxyribonuclease III [archaeon]MBT3731288.1 exodeoxyribonuclease III [archaeon]MBT4669941.1 exodeoxyribonuclease III [archaeon]MBT5029766.1 exodeoxyribonuclease III [archaeon]MBT5287485.1 exodeoxyribonuclease III [archaeon]
MEILSWNINGIRAIEKKGFLEFMEKKNPDIICLQEIKAMEEQIPDTINNIEDYHLVVNSAERKGYSGVCVYTKIKPLSVKKGFGVSEFDKEGRALVLEYEKFILMNIYYPNGKMSDERLKYKLDFYDHFLKFCSKQKKPLVICGDVNTAHNEIDLARPKGNDKVSGFLREERDWLDKFEEKGLIDTFRHFHPETVKYSWWSVRTRARERNVGWRLDYFYVTKNILEKVKKAFILNEVMGSDHCPVGVNIEI